MNPAKQRVSITALSMIVCSAALLFPVTVPADDLPTELLLRCDLKQTWFMNVGGKTDLLEDKLSKDFRLKNGVFGWTDLAIPIGEDCKLDGGEITCRVIVRRTHGKAPE